MKINPITKCKEQETQDLSWETLMGKKTQQLLRYRSIDNVYKANTMPERETLDAKNNPSAKP